MKPEIRRYPNIEELNADAASFISTWARSCVAERGVFHFALSGGRSPRKLYEKLARPPFDVLVPWSHTHLYIGDERCVPPSHPDSNYRMVLETLISNFAVPAERVHRPPYESPTPQAAVEKWEQMLKACFPTAAEEGQPPALDLVLLGIGTDGHTASLFPGDPALLEDQHWVAVVPQPQGDPRVQRLTFTLPLINRARCVLFLVSGSGKREVVEKILSADAPQKLPYPAARVQPAGRLLWLLDGAYL